MGRILDEILSTDYGGELDVEIRDYEVILDIIYN